MANLRLNTWEMEAIREKLADDHVVAWLRNPARQPWSVCVPYPVGTTQRPMYPDLLIVRELDDKLIVDVLDPHDPGRPDSSDKGKGLAQYATIHGHELGAIDMAARLDGTLRRLHLKDADTRAKVAAAASPNALSLLYPID